MSTFGALKETRAENLFKILAALTTDWLAAISGAYNGVSALPDGLTASVKDSDEIRALGEQLYRAWVAR